MKIIIYGSCYGTAKQYAEELSKRTKIDLKTYQEIKNINQYETIIYIGALYAGGVLGLLTSGHFFYYKNLFLLFSHILIKQLLFVTIIISTK
ncbi:MAG: flavodoxin domain-containing protein [Bacilli bacterium]